MTSLHIKCLNNPPWPKKRILFLGYNESQTRIIETLVSNKCYVDHTEDPIDGSGDYDLVISFGYRHILRKHVIDRFGCPIFNLHISYLPYNRGADPHFWAFYDDTPSGVTIHLIDEGIDTGPIVYQRYVNFHEAERTFTQTYSRLIAEIEELFIENVSNVLAGNWVAEPQRGGGSHHFDRDLPKNFSGWDSVIADEIERLTAKR